MVYRRSASLFTSRSVALWLGAGVAVSLLIAIGFGLVGPPSSSRLKQTATRWPESPPPGFPRYVDTITRPGMMPMGFSASVLGRRLYRTSVVDHVHGVWDIVYRREELQTGWPFPCLRAIRFQSPVAADNASWFVTGMSVTDGPAGASEAFGRTVALVPQPFVLAINSMFWGVVVGVTHASLRLRRRRRRQAAGLCVICAYPLSSSGICPECGFSPDTTAGCDTR